MQQPAVREFYARTRAAKKILVVDLGFLGDTLHLIPSLWEIRRHYPEAAVQVVSSPLGAEVLRLAPCVNRVFPIELHPQKRTLREQWRLVRALRREQFDVAFNFGGNDRTVILTGLCGARWRVAHQGGRKHFWNRWLIANWVPRQDPDLTVFEQRRLVLAACGFKLQAPRFDLKLDANSLMWAEAIVPAGAVHLSINSANPLKEWPFELNVALLQQLWRGFPQLKFVASAGTREREQARLRTFAAAVNDARLVLLPERLSIAQLGAALSRCHLHIGPDSGVMHLAAALGIPTISFFREQKGYEAWLPVGAQHKLLTRPCSCVDHHAAPCERSERAACLASISPEQVAAMVCDQLGLSRGEGGVKP